MTLDAALGAAAAQADDARAGKLLAALRQHVGGGESLPSALDRYPRTFSPLYRGLVAAAVESGRLPDVLGRLADYLEARIALRERFTTALIYPVLVGVIALAVIAVLLVYVVPQVVSVYQQSRQTLPWLTQALIAASAFFRGRSTGSLPRWPRRPDHAQPPRRLRAAWHAAAAPTGRRPAGDRDRHRSFAARWRPGGQRHAAARRWTRRATSCGAAAAPGRDRCLALVREGCRWRALKGSGCLPVHHLVANGGRRQLAPMLERGGRAGREAERRLTWFAALLQPTIVAMGAIVW
jgi:general secretion pathway protein F